MGRDGASALLLNFTNIDSQRTAENSRKADLAAEWLSHDLLSSGVSKLTCGIMA